MRVARISEVVVTLLVALLLLVDALLICLLFVAFLLFRVVLVGLQVASFLVGEPFVHLCSEALPLVAHLVVHGCVLALRVFFVDFLDGALHVEVTFTDIIVFAVEDFLEAAHGVLDVHLFSWTSGEHFGN